jgi:biotin carboxyl carrier protein
VLATLPSGWRNVPSGPQQTQFAVGGQHAGGQHTEVRYRLHGGVLWAAVDGTELPGLVLWSQAPDRVDLEVAGIRRVITVDQAGEVYYADSALGSGVLTEVPRFPEPRAAAQAGSLLAPMPGTVITVVVGVGDQVSAGDPVVVLEAMKMEHTVAAPHDGMVTEVRTEAGQAVDTGAVLAVLAVVAEPS